MLHYKCTIHKEIKYLTLRHFRNLYSLIQTTCSSLNDVKTHVRGVPYKTKNREVYK